MANLVFPQLASGALAQFPIRKTRFERTVKNLLLDGSLIALPDPGASRLSWQLSYTSLSPADWNALATHFAACRGRLHAFTFIDPTDNMLNSSSNFRSAAWHVSNTIDIVPNVADPTGANAAFTTTNLGQVPAQIAQTLNVPAGYQYCFSIFAYSSTPTTVQLVRSGASLQEAVSLAVNEKWSRLVSSGKLTDGGDNLTVAIVLQPGQQIFLSGPQLEAQIAPSRYLPTAVGGGVYATAHWGVDELVALADGPDLFSTAFTVETQL